MHFEADDGCAHDQRHQRLVWGGCACVRCRYVCRDGRVGMDIGVNFCARIRGMAHRYLLQRLRLLEDEEGEDGGPEDLALR